MKKFFKFKQTSRKIESAQFYKRIAEIVESKLPETLKLNKAFNKMKENLPLLEELKIQNRKVPLTNDMKALSVKLDKAVSVLTRYSEVKIRQGKMVNAEVESLHHFIESYLRGYAGKNFYQKTGIISKMMTVFTADSALMQSAETEELTAVFEKISDVYNELDTVYKSRRKSIANREKLRTDEIKRTLYFSIREMFASIEVAELSDPDINYTDLINELNQEILRFNSGSKSRTQPEEEVIPESESTDEDNPTEGI